MEKNPIDLFQNQPLKMDAHGRSNMLILGTTDDDPDHPGATLTDSMMVLSVDQKKHVRNLCFSWIILLVENWILMWHQKSPPDPSACQGRVLLIETCTSFSIGQF